MNLKQKTVIEALRSDITFKLNGMDQEIKSFEVEDHQYFASVYIIFNDINEDKKCKYFPIRSHAQLFIGPRGGITYPVWVNKEKMVTRSYKGKDILQVSKEQKRLCYSRFV